jgi:hypothetical protein
LRGRRRYLIRLGLQRGANREDEQN